MAVIQDLPAELLYRILELMENVQRTTDQQAETRRSFARTSLVARSWRASSQYLLASTLHTHIEDCVWGRYLEVVSNHSSPSVSTVSTLQHLALGDATSSAGALARLQQRGIAVQELAIYTDSHHLNSSHVRLLQGVRRLTLRGSVKLDDGLGGEATLSLEVLHVYSKLNELPAFMLPLPTVAPRLTRLTLDDRYSDFSDSLNAPLQHLAPHLLHLRLELKSTSPLQGGLFAWDRFLSVCTSLTSLELGLINPSNLTRILSSLPSPLILLNVYLILRSVEEEGELMAVQLAGVFDLPCLAKLKRWRLTGYIWLSASSRSISEPVMDEWRAACRARGIEPRGAERYFTD